MKHQYITNESGKKIAVVIPIEEYDKIVEKLEMLADIKAYDSVLTANEPRIPYGKAIKQIEAKRKRRK
jgi:hypothetical protein